MGRKVGSFTSARGKKGLAESRGGAWPAKNGRKNPRRGVEKKPEYSARYGGEATGNPSGTFGTRI